LSALKKEGIPRGEREKFRRGEGPLIPEGEKKSGKGQMEKSLGGRSSAVRTLKTRSVSTEKGQTERISSISLN